MLTTKRLLPALCAALTVLLPGQARPDAPAGQMAIGAPALRQRLAQAPQTAAAVEPASGTDARDTTPPAVPAGLVTTPNSTTKIDLRWDAATDNVRVTGYYLFREGKRVATTTKAEHTDSGLTPGETYRYQVAAFDAAGNVSNLTAPVIGTTSAGDIAGGYDFENNTQGWINVGRATAMRSEPISTGKGAHSLGAYLQGVSAGAPGFVVVRPPNTLIAGKTVTAQAILLTPATTVLARLYAKDANGVGVAGPVIALMPGAWAPLTMALPAEAATPLSTLGVQFLSSAGEFTGPVAVDDVHWNPESAP